MKQAELLELLDFSEWTLHEVKDIRVLTDDELKEYEINITKYIDEMSQEDHVNLVITYKAKIKELYMLLDECFENAIAPLGAGETIYPNSKSEDLAQRIFKNLSKKPLKIPIDWDTEDTAILEM